MEISRINTEVEMKRPTHKHTLQMMFETHLIVKTIEVQMLNTT